MKLSLALINTGALPSTSRDALIMFRNRTDTVRHLYFIIFAVLDSRKNALTFTFGKIPFHVASYK